MRPVQLGIVTAVLLLLPAGAALEGLPRLTPSDLAPADGCSMGAEGHQLCEWWFNTTEQVGEIGVTYALDLPARALVTFTVVFDGRDQGWYYRFVEDDGGDARWVSTTRHETEATETETHVVASDTHLLFLEETAEHRLEFYFHSSAATIGFLGDLDSLAPSFGAFHLVAVIEPLPAGVVPTRPAATASDPHLADLERDAARPEVDLLAGWLDDAALEDGLFDAYVRVRSLDHIEFNDTINNRVSTRFTRWDIHFEVLGTEYLVNWVAYDRGADAPESACRLFRGEELLMTPSCTWDLANATLHAIVPERAVGDPGSGTPFTLTRVVTMHGQDLNTATTEDEAESQRYGFALGGPEVWSVLNPRLDPPAAPAAAWYQAPLASDNIPDTLSVLGALLAGVTFLVGFIAIRRNRRQTRELLARVDALVAAHEADARAALLELGKLENDFAALYRRGAINESQYQLATQRVVAAASRMAIRRELGLDDGTPGEAADETRVRVDVRRSP